MEKLERRDRISEEAQTMRSLRVQQLRSRKPRKVRLVQRPPEKSQEELDYIRYVVGDPQTH